MSNSIGDAVIVKLFFQTLELFYGSWKLVCQQIKTSGEEVFVGTCVYPVLFPGHGRGESFLKYVGLQYFFLLSTSNYSRIHILS